MRIFKNYIVIFIIIVHSGISLAQTNEQRKTKKWLEKNNIALNMPITPSGFYRQTDCKGNPIYRKELSDTIILYNWNGSIVEELEPFKKTTKKVGFNTYQYPIEILGNGTILVNLMSKREFIWRNDTLYFLDDFNEDGVIAHIKYMDEVYYEGISMDEYEKKLKEFDISKYPYTPKFKIIYFKGIFDNSNFYEFSEKENFRKEKVVFIAKWNEGGKTIYEINLDTHTNGRYRFTDDMSKIEENNCRKK